MFVFDHSTLGDVAAQSTDIASKGRQRVDVSGWRLFLDVRALNLFVEIDISAICEMHQMKGVVGDIRMLVSSECSGK